MRHKLSIDARYRALNIAIKKAREDAVMRYERLYHGLNTQVANNSTAIDYVRYSSVDALHAMYNECFYDLLKHRDLPKAKYPDRHINWLRKQLSATIATEAHLLVAVSEAYKVTHERVIDVLKNQQELGPEFQKVLFDNLESLYEN